MMVAASSVLGCGAAEKGAAPASLCGEPDATTSPIGDDARDAELNREEADAPEIDLDVLVVKDAPPDTHVVVDTAPPDPDDEISCRGMIVPGPRNTVCDAVVRLDYDTKVVLGWRLECGSGGWKDDDARARMLAEASLGLDLPLDARMTGLHPAFLHVPSVTSPGAFAIVHPEIGRVVVAGTTIPGGGELTETAWNPPWDPTRCFPEYELLGSHAIVPEGEATFGDGLLKEIARDAWYGPIGAWWEENGGCTTNSYQAGVMRWAPEPEGAYREWIVLIELGTHCDLGDD